MIKKATISKFLKEKQTRKFFVMGLIFSGLYVLSFSIQAINLYNPKYTNFVDVKKLIKYDPEKFFSLIAWLLIFSLIIIVITTLYSKFNKLSFEGKSILFSSSMLSAIFILAHFPTQFFRFSRSFRSPYGISVLSDFIHFLPLRFMLLAILIFLISSLFTLPISSSKPIKSALKYIAMGLFIIGMAYFFLISTAILNMTLVPILENEILSLAIIIGMIVLGLVNLNKGKMLYYWVIVLAIFWVALSLGFFYIFGSIFMVEKFYLNPILLLPIFIWHYFIIRFHNESNLQIFPQIAPKKT